MQTNTDKLYSALKLLGIAADPTDKPKIKDWYTASGEYLGRHGTDDGLDYLQRIMKLARA